MENIKNYKCPCCADSLIFDGTNGNLRCPSCANEFDIDSMDALDEAKESAKVGSKYDWNMYTPRSFEGENVDFSTYSCPSCGAKITGDDTMGSTVCPYCGSATIIKGQFEGTLQPDYVIPFKLDKKIAMQKFEDACSKAPFLPDEYKDKKKIEEMSGVYVPFWMFDCNCEGSANYAATRVHRWHDSKYNYIRTDFYTLVRGGNIDFANVPVDASQKVDNTYTEALEPFDYNEAVEFNSAYLSGYLADKYDVSAEESSKKANERIKNSTEQALKNTTDGYISVTQTSSNINFSEGKIRYALLPVWMLNVKYDGQMYHYEINGQTGKVVGRYPICKKKRNKFFAKVFGISLAVAAVVGFIYLGFLA